jgi:hypothetical protein
MKKKDNGRDRKQDLRHAYGLSVRDPISGMPLSSNPQQPYVESWPQLKPGAV